MRLYLWRRSRSGLAPWLIPAVIIAVVIIAGFATPASAQLSRVGVSTTIYQPGLVRGTHVGHDPVNGVYLLVMGAGSIWGRFVDTAGQPLSETFVIHAQVDGPTGSYATLPVVSYSPDVTNGAGGLGGFLVAWNDGESKIPNVIRGRLVAYAAPGRIASAEATLGDAVDGGSFFEMWPAVAYSKTSHRFLVAWTTLAWGIRGRMVDVALNPITDVAPLENAGGTMGPSTVWNPATDQFGLFYDQFGPSSAWVAFRRVFADGTVSPRTSFGVTAGTFETGIDITAANNYVLVWGLAPGAKSAVFDQSGNPVLDSTGGVATTYLSSRLGHNQSLDIAYNSLSDTLLAVSSDLGGTLEVGSVEVTAGGAPMSFLLATDSSTTGSYYPKVTARPDAKQWNISYARNQDQGTDQIIATASGGVAPPPPPPTTCSVSASAAAPSSVSLGSGAQFTSAAVVGSGCGTGATYSWSFGDSGTSSSQNPLHTYASANTYTWSVTVTAGSGSNTAIDTKSGTISVFGTCWVSASAAAPSAVSFGSGAQFTSAALVASACGTGATYAWSFGNSATSSSQNPLYTYPTAGIYSWTLTVTAGTGGNTGSDTKSGTITVGGAVPAACWVSASAAGPSTPPQTGAGAQFTSAALVAPGCGTGATYAWSFGDSATSAAQNPLYTYTAAGTYNWSLTVTAGSGSSAASDTKSGSVTVAAGTCTPNGALVSSAPSLASPSLAGMWVDTGVPVSAGQLLTVSVDAGQTWSDGISSYTAAGGAPNSNSQVPEPGAPQMALVGKIGASGTPFVVGLFAQFTSAASGNLYLAPNDLWYDQYNNSGTMTVSICRGGSPCAISATATVPTSAAPGDPVAFTASCSPNNCGVAMGSYSWSFGDGTTSTAQNPTHVYSSVGTYSWTLTVQMATATTTRSGSITVAPTCTPSSATVFANPGVSAAALWQSAGTSVTSGQAVTISTPGTWTSNGTAYTAAGNGSDMTSGANVALPGQARLSLLGRIGTSGTPFLVGASSQFTAGASGTLYFAPNYEWYMLWQNSGSLSASVCVGAAGGCSVTAAASVPATASTGSSVAFAGTATPSNCGASTATYSWDFGDSSSSTSQSPTHIYAAAGTYTWTLTVQVGSASSTTTGTVVVSSAPSCTTSTTTVLANPGIQPSLWQSNGVSVTSGQAVTLTAPGTWTINATAYSAAGNSGDMTTGGNVTLPGAPRGALLARIGSGTPFLVGTSKQFTADATGTLSFAPNYEWYMVWQNTGSLVVSTCK
jgi:PKD repeat protein